MAVRAKNAEIRTITGNLSGNATSATTATNDTKGQAITSYIRALSISGRTITYTKGDGTTGTITTQDSTYSHPTGAGYNHIPAGGSSNQVLRWKSSGVAEWSDDKGTTYTAGSGLSLSGTTFSNAGVRSIATGGTNGTISVNTNGNTVDVAVKGLGSAAYTASSAYAAASHTHNYMASQPSYIEFSILSSAGHGGYIDFHYNGSTADYTSRIIEAASGTLKLNDVLISGNTITGNLSGNASTATKATYLNYTNSSEINFSGNDTTTKVYFNWRKQSSDAASGNTALTRYLFGNRNAGTGGVTLQADYFTGNAATATTASKLGTTTVGGTAKPMYLNAGTATALSATVGGTTQPVYLNAGTITASNASVGSADIPVYMSNGTITASTKKFSDYLPLSGGTISGDILVGYMDIKSFRTFAGGEKIGWVKILKADLNSNNNIHGQNLIITLNRMYTSPPSESYTFSVNFGWRNANIVQLNGMAGNRIIEKFRAVRDDTNHKLYLEYYVNTSYTTYKNNVHVTVIHSSSHFNFVGCDEVQTEADSALVILSTINTASSKIVGNLEGNATTATTASKLGTTTVGGTAKPVYLNAGTATALSATVGSTDTPVYLNAGMITSTGKSFSSYLPLSGGTMTGDISFKGTSGTTHTMIAFKSEENTYGDGIIIGGGGLTVIGAGESAATVAAQYGGGEKFMCVAADGGIYFYSNVNDGWDARKTASFSAAGVFSAPSFAGPLSGNASSASTLLNPGRLTTTAALDGFLEANRFKYATIGAISGLSGTYNNNDGMILSVGWENTAWGHQIYIDNSSYDIHHRYKNSSNGWQAWSKILDTSNYKSYCTPANIGAATTAVATTSANGLMSSTDKAKLDGIASGANAYSHPSHTAYSSGLYKITVNALGHVTAATAVTKADITALGIPGSDTNTWRGIQNNLTSDSTTDSLSAAQGKVLKGLVDGKAAASHTHSGYAASSHTHNYAGSSSAGGDATNALKLGGLSASTSATKSTIVARDSNNYVFFNYINSNTSNSENPTISQIIVTNGSDSYYRKASLAHLKSSLGSMPASDVYAWAKASTKPSYTASEVGAAAASHTHSGYVATSGGAMTGALKVNCSNVGTDYTTYRFRNIGFGTTSTPTSDSTYGGNGAIYFMYS